MAPLTIGHLLGVGTLAQLGGVFRLFRTHSSGLLLTTPTPPWSGLTTNQGH